MSVIFTTYHIEYEEENSTINALDQVCQEFVANNDVTICGVDIVMKKYDSLRYPITVKVGSYAYGSEFVRNEVSSALLGADYFTRIHVPFAPVDLSGGSSFYITVDMPGAGDAQYRRLKNVSSAITQGNISTVVNKLIHRDGDDVETVQTACVLCVEIYDTYSDIQTPTRPPVYREPSMDWKTQSEIQAHQQLYGRGMASEWMFDDKVLPINPIGCNIVETTLINTHKTVDARTILVIEQNAASPRIVAGHTIELQFPLVGRDFVTWLKQYQEFDISIYAEIPLLDPNLYPEVAHMDDPSTETAYYLKRYWGALDNWKENASNIVVYRKTTATDENGSLVSSSDYTVDYKNGYILFNTIQSSAAFILLSYVWRPKVKVLVDPQWIPGRGFTMARPKVTLMEVDSLE